jgi:hypothetical protein
VEFLLWFTGREGGSPAEADGPDEMKKLAGELASEGKLLRGAPLGPAAARVRVRDGKAFVSDGPLAESQEVVGGFWIVDVSSREEAIEIARRSPHARYGAVEVHPIRRRFAFADPGEGAPFLLAFGREPGLIDPDGARLREMIAFGEGLAREGTLLETAPLAVDPPPARIEGRDGKTLVTDGPFAEAKEAIGGYSLVRVEGRAAAIEGEGRRARPLAPGEPAQIQRRQRRDVAATLGRAGDHEPLPCTSRLRRGAAQNFHVWSSRPRPPGRHR